MINQRFKDMLSAKSVIRELSEYATKKGEEIGFDQIYDFTLGNPSVPTTTSFTKAVERLYHQEDACALHGYSPSLGIPSVKEAVAASLKNRYGIPYQQNHIFMTSGAAGAIAHAVRAVTKPGDKVLTFAPFFPEYMPYVNETGAVLEVIDSNPETFLPDMERFESALTEDVAAVLINSPNNPTGVAYKHKTLEAMTKIMRSKEEAYHHEIFLISDEPYREIYFSEEELAYPANYYDNTLTCYSFSKSLSLPGERIGYVAVHPAAKDSEYLVPMMGQISRGIGHNCPASTMQLAVAQVLEDTSDISIYETNCNLWYQALIEMGQQVIKPDGTFYIFPKAPEEDAVAFCKKALAYNLVFVPSDSFGIKGYYRIAYCTDVQKVKDALPIMKKFLKEEYA